MCQRRYSLPAVALGAVLPLCLVALAGCDGKPTADPASAAAGNPYAGSDSCQECHQEAFTDWKKSHHANAQRTPYAPLDMQAFDPPRDIRHGSETSRAELRDGKYTLITTGSDGKQQPFEPVGVIGVDPLWQYLIPAPGGRLQVTELAFDPAKKEWFNVYGEEDRKYWEWGHWSQRGMTWNSMCATCHTTNLQKNYSPGIDGYRTTYVELGVGCEQCHGPMRDHADWQKANRDRPGDPTLIKRDWGQYFASCASCHARRIDLTGSFQVGEKFSDHFDLVLPDSSNTFYPDGQNWDEDFEITAFTLSYMHDAGIRCTDCHAHHGSKIKVKGNDLCMRCHNQPVTTKIAILPEAHGHHPMDKAGSLCVDCHMPQTPYMQRHLRRDHGMTIPDPLLTKEFGIPNACNRCHTDKTVDWSIEWMDKWYGDRMKRPARDRARLLARLKNGDRSAASETAALLAREHNAYWRATIIRFLSTVIDEAGPAASPAQLAVFKALGDDATQVQGAAIDALEPLVASPLESLLPGLRAALQSKLDHPSRLVRIKAAWALRRWLPADAPARQDLLAFLRQNEDQPLGAFRWAQLLMDTGDLPGALTWYEKTVSWDPGSAPFRHAYATALDMAGRPDQALVQALKAVELEPDQAIHRYALGLLYAETNQLEEARQALRDAVQRDPGQARFWYNLALSESKLGDVSAALDAIRRAEQLQPGVADYPLTRARICLDHNQPDMARSALQRALEISPGNQQARQMLSGL